LLAVSSFKGETRTSGTFSQGFIDNFLGFPLIFFTNTKSSALERKSVGNLVRLLFERKPLVTIFTEQGRREQRERERSIEVIKAISKLDSMLAAILGPSLVQFGQAASLECLLGLFQLSADHRPGVKLT
jgi:hypothetical protein